MKFSSKIKQCNLSPIRKFYPYTVEAKKKGKKIYQLNIGQPDIKTPEAFFEAVKNFNAPVLAYAPSPGIPEMVQAIQKYYKGIGIDYAESDIVVTTGGSEALQIVLNCILDNGDEIIIPEPFYPNYNTFVKATGANIRPLTTSVDEGYRYAVREKIEACINENTRAIMFTNPGNPTGVVLTQEEMRLIADIAKEHNLFVIGDEVYREFVYGGEKLASMGHFEDIQDNVIIIDSVSKRFSACGARIGTVITKNKELQQHIMKFCQARLSVPTLDQIASAALYGVPATYFDEVREEYKKRRDTIYAKLSQIEGVVCKAPQGAFYVMAKLPVEDAEEFLIWLLTEFDDNGETVMFAPGGGFYATPGSGKNEVRLAYVLNQKDLERAMDLLALGIKKYNETH
ncbi:pyridoxal phosphate-dependent aminotransferase [Sinanaerobacter sp. ZZT-01]|uniref:pyridoxal phosphate-dependent aminotransferase n=1 Tax=Sinanaerobacter sp. ZZT-01 TaxID=3111540 RepID=UPI002D79AEF1|nr:pyridoxal phosphate-dependent aminotransferase [Sinanaerobacter sp. ZZT-01]WRR94319.1 pyridoxal phosphate-dependent aminotransferase [Sinanaerobacter sp. ZZT-01]